MHRWILPAQRFLALVILLSSRTAGAGVASTTGAVTLGPAPASVLSGQSESNTAIQLFEEKTGHTLSSDVTVDMSTHFSLYDPPNGRTVGTILSGTEVNSYYLHFDAVSGVRRALGSVRFDEPILGVVALGDQPPRIDTLSPTHVLGAPGTIYPTLPNFVGLETSRDKLWLYPTILALDIVSASNVDQIRVITAATGTLAPPNELEIIAAKLSIEDRYLSSMYYSREIVGAMKGPMINPIIVDPIATGAYVHVYSTTRSACYFLPQSNWVPDGAGFVYLDQAQSNGPCSGARIKRKLLGFKCFGPTIGYTLDEMAGQGTVNIDVTFGAVRFCTTLGPPYVQRDDIVDLMENPDSRGNFKANRRANAPAFGGCVNPPGACP